MTAYVNKILPYLLKPLAWVYGFITDVRNWLFDHNVLKSEQFEVPVVSVGNLTVGGTGKTPHVEYLVNMLSTYYKIAVLSRGYKRKTKGFVLANMNSTPDTIGDESMQIYKKLGNKAIVAVCESRVKGIKEIMKLYPDVQLILLDDSFQHRYVKPKVNILVMDYSRPIYEDKLLPLGRLREGEHNVTRADMVIVTKCPVDLPPLSYRLVKNKLELMPYQKLYFSGIRYGQLEPVFPNDKPYHVDLSTFTSRDSVLLVTGVANPRGFVRHFKKYPFKVSVSHYPDHHDFSRIDLQDILKKFRSLKGERKIIITTEKDAVRMAYNPYFPTSLKQYVYYIPISVRLIRGLDENDLIEDLTREISK